MSQSCLFSHLVYYKRRELPNSGIVLTYSLKCKNLRAEAKQKQLSDDGDVMKAGFLAMTQQFYVKDCTKNRFFHLLLIQWKETELLY